MKSRLNLIAAALVVLLGSMVWVVQDHAAVGTVAALPMAAAPTAPVVGFVPAADAAPALAAAAVPAVVPVAAAVAAAPAQSERTPMVSIDASGGTTYVARDGDTISQLAIALLGADSKANRDAIVAANGSLQSNPDRVLTGQAYSIASSATAVAGDVDDQQRDAAPAATATAIAGGAPKRAPAMEPASAEKPDQNAIPAAAAGPKLRYTAQAGDTVRNLAADLLGGDTKLNRDAIIESNASLQKNPDHVVAGKSYRIEVPNGLSADPTATRATVPTTQPDADEAARLSVGRSLRYTATSGDTVSKLAFKLLGSDTAANRDLIIQSNPSLKANPDQLTAGQTYWIPAPTAEPAR
ncbi:MAG: LysM domain-containing protein [Planctomycetota bacterium]|nr:LysM domain-containing protein [Planctomycetota bacterium]